MTPPSAAPAGERVPGWYWVRFGREKHWELLYLDGDSYSSPVETHSFPIRKGMKIGERVLPPDDRPQRPPEPSAAPEVAALAERLEALAKKATPGPWNATTWPEGAFMITAGETVDPDSGVVLCQRQDWNHNAEESRANGQLIGDLVNNLPTILAALRSAPDGWTAGAEAMREAASRSCFSCADTFRKMGIEDIARAFESQGNMVAIMPIPPAKAPRDEGGGP